MASTLNFKLCMHFMAELTMIQIVFREINSLFSTRVPKVWMALMPVAVCKQSPSHTMHPQSLCSNHSLTRILCSVQLSPLLFLLNATFEQMSLLWSQGLAHLMTCGRVYKCVHAFLYTQYTSTSCWNGVTSPHWDLIYCLTAIHAAVCRCKCVRAC